MPWYKGVQCKLCSGRIALARLAEERAALIFAEGGGQQLSFGVKCPHCTEDLFCVPGDLVVFYAETLGNTDAEAAHELGIVQSRLRKPTARAERPQPSADARTRYEFVVNGEILLAHEELPTLLASRGEELWRIDVPRNHVLLAAAVKVPERPREVPAASTAAILKTFVIRMEREGPPGSDEASRLLKQPAVSLFTDLLSWIRVLTRQYWVGYKDAGSTENAVAVSLIDHGTVTPITGSAKFGVMYVYGRPLDEVTWLSIGPRLSRAEKPQSSHLFFCDALADIVERDFTQGIAALVRIIHERAAKCQFEIVLAA